MRLRSNFSKPLALWLVASSVLVSSGCNLSVGAGKRNWESGTGYTHTQRTSKGVLSHRKVWGFDFQFGTNHSAASLGWLRETYLQPAADHPNRKPSRVLRIGPWALPLGIYWSVKDEAGKKIGEKTWGLWVIRSYPRFTFLNEKEKARKRNDVALDQLKWEPTLQICKRWAMGWASYPRGWNAALPYHYFEYVLVPPGEFKKYKYKTGEDTYPGDLRLEKKSAPARKKRPGPKVLK